MKKAFFVFTFVLPVLIAPLQYELITSDEFYTKPNLRKVSETNLQTFDNIYHIMTIPVCVGVPPQCFKVLYDTGMPYMILSDKSTKAKFASGFEASKSTTVFSPTNFLFSFPYRTGSINAREVSDFVYLEESKKIPYTFNFLLAFNTSTTYNFDGILGLGNYYPPKDDGNTFDLRFSFIEYLKANKLIRNKIFAHEYLNRTYGKLYIDEVPKSMGKDYFKCNVAPFLAFVNKWHCELRSITLTNGVAFTSPGVVAFDTGYVDIRAPLSSAVDVFNEFVEESKGKCEIQQIDLSNENFIKKLFCSEDTKISNFPNINFNIREFKLTLFNTDMFRLVENKGVRKYVSKIIGDSKSEFWNIGEPALKNYDMIFDYESNSVGFKENINYYGESWTGVIVLCVILFGLIGVGGWVYLNRRRIFLKELNSDEIEQMKQKEAFSGSQLGEIKETS